jgi:Zn-dependent protease
VYVHASLLVIIVGMMYFATQYFATQITHIVHSHTLDDGSIYGLVAAAVLLLSLVLHEIAHALAAWQLGGNVDLVVLGPLGGMNLPNMPREPHREVAVALAGPLVHFLVLLALGPVLMLQEVNLGEILPHPFYPENMLNGSLGIVAAKMAFWLNWLLLLVNLIPAPALDGGRALRSVLWPVMGYRGAIRTVSRSGMLTALMFCLLALVLHDPQNNYPLIPIWFPLVLMALYLYFSSQQEVQQVGDEDPEDDLFGYDFSQGFTSLEQPTGPRRRQQGPGPMRRWLQQRQEMKERRMREIEADEERRVDDVLVRVKELGVDGLSPEDRSLLQRVSARYRNRLQS